MGRGEKAADAEDGEEGGMGGPLDASRSDYRLTESGEKNVISRAEAGEDSDVDDWADTFGDPTREESRAVQEFEQAQARLQDPKNDEKKRRWLRLRHKVQFTLAVANLVVLALGVFHKQWLMPYYYSAKAPILIFLRWYFYTKDHHQWFLLDFCYFCNLALLIYLWAFPDNPYLFTMVFAASHGPLAWAVVAFRNSLVFHSLDKTTSAFIHISPPLVCYSLRWYTNTANEGWYKNFEVCISDDCRDSEPSPCVEEHCRLPYDDLTSWLWAWAIPLGFFVGHSLLYFFIVQGLCHAKLKKDKRYLTSFRFLTADKNSLVFKLVNCCGHKGRVPMYGFFNAIFAMLTIGPAIIYMNYQWANILFLCLIVSVCTWNGANFYVEVFARKYAGWEAAKRSGSVSSSAAASVNPRTTSVSSGNSGNIVQNPAHEE